MSRQHITQHRLSRLMRRFLSPQDTKAGIAVACVLLLAEAVLGVLIIWRVPCASLSFPALFGSARLTTVDTLCLCDSDSINSCCATLRPS